MKNVGDRSLMIGALLVSLIVAAIVWFLAISPRLSSAQDARDAAEEQRGTNDILEVTLAKREKDAQAVPELTRELYGIREILSPIEDVPSVRRMINGILSSQGLPVLVERISPMIMVPGGASLLAPMEQVGLTSEIEEMSFTTLEATPMTLEIEGPASQVLEAIRRLQSGDHRYFHVYNLTITASGDQGSDTVRAVIGAAFFTLDRGIPGITVRPSERPWPGTEEEAVDNPSSPFESLAPSGIG